MNKKEQLTLAGKIIVACFELLGWIYNSKGRKGNSLDGYGHGLLLMFLMKLVLWRQIVPANWFPSMIIWSSKTCKKKLNIKNISVLKKKWPIPLWFLRKYLNVKWNSLRKIKSVIFSPIHDIDNNPFLRNNHEK